MKSLLLVARISKVFTHSAGSFVRYVCSFAHVCTIAKRIEKITELVSGNFQERIFCEVLNHFQLQPYLPQIAMANNDLVLSQRWLCGWPVSGQEPPL